MSDNPLELGDPMPDAPPPPNQQFWLLTGEVPTGPFSVDQVHAKIAAGDATWQTPACPVGGGNWLPLVRTPGIGPSAPPRTVADTRSPDAHPHSAPVASAPPADAPAPAGNREGPLAAKRPALANRSTRWPDTMSPAVPKAPTTARQEHQTQASAKPPQPAAESNGNGPSEPDQSNRFWLLVGTETTGPFRAEDIRAKLQSGKLSPDAKARRVGTEIWVPLTEAVGPLPPVSSAPESKSFLQAIGIPPQTIHVGIGLLLMAGLLAVAKGCKEDAQNRPSLKERLKEQRSNDPLPPLPPPKTKSQPTP